MKKDGKKIILNANDLGLADHENKDFEIFKSRVANAVLDYMESQSDPDLIECLEKANIFLTNISMQMENVFSKQKHSFKDQNEMFEIVDDFFSTNQQTLSNTIHWLNFYELLGELLNFFNNFVAILQQFVEVIKVTNKIFVQS